MKISLMGKTYYAMNGMFLSCDSNPDMEGELATMWFNERDDYQTIGSQTGRIYKKSEYQNFDFLSNGIIYRVRDGEILATNGISDEISLTDDITEEEFNSKLNLNMGI